MQQTFSDWEYAGKKKQPRRDRFFGDIEALTPWPLLEAQIAPFYATSTSGLGRPYMEWLPRSGCALGQSPYVAALPRVSSQR